MPPARIQTSHLREPLEGSAGASRSGHTGSYSGVFGELVEPSSDGRTRRDDRATVHTGSDC